MPPNANQMPYESSLGFRPLSGYTYTRKGADIWLDAKRKTDGAEGYWRVHNGLYDVSNFMKDHPGGAMWLELTKGTDITEAFEAHHIRDVSEKMLKKFYVRDAKTPRQSPYTFDENGFYRTLKRRVRDVIEKTPKKAINISGIYIDLLLLATFGFSILACNYWNFWLAIIAGYCLSSLTIAAHNYFHQKDNFRMYYFTLSLMNIREWRVSHALSHHLFTNTIYDMEMLIFVPLADYFPVQKGFVQKYVSWMYSLILWLFLFHFSLISRILNAINTRDVKSFSFTDLMPYTLPLMMYYLLGTQSFLHTIGMWTVVIFAGSFIFTFVGINAAHHHPKIFHDGDKPRQTTDWGLLQIDAVADRYEITGSHYLVLTNFGDHGLHHLFPTLDHGLLDAVYPVFKKTLEEFNSGIKMTSQFELIKGQFQQLARCTPNPEPPTNKL